MLAASWLYIAYRSQEHQCVGPACRCLLAKKRSRNMLLA